MILPPRSRRGGPRLLCGLHHRHVGHSASRVHPCSWQIHRISIAKKAFQAGVLWVRRNFVFLCRTTVRTCPFVSHALSLGVQQYSRVPQKSISINNPRSHYVCTIRIHRAGLQQEKEQQRRDGEIQLTLCPEWSALPFRHINCTD